jgi:DNA invertase Pin-like site-specific DNA recombinase
MKARRLDMLRALIWCSVSTKAQAEDDKLSLPEQERMSREISKKEGWNTLEVLHVPGHSRRYIDIHECSQDMLANNIDAFDRLLHHWRERDFDVLIVRDGNRFARTQTLHAYVVERTIEMGARIFSMNDGWVDERNYRMFIAMNGYSAATQVDQLIAGQRATKEAKTANGIFTGSRIPYSHKLIRNEYGRGLRLEIDESKRRLFEDAATILLEGVGWKHIEAELYKRFGHMRTNGNRFTKYYFYHLFHNPWFWGHGARYYKKVELPNGQKTDLWVFDESYPVPQGVLIHRNTHEAVYQGEMAEKVKAELRRRRMAIRGTARPHRTKKFSGIILCGYCGFYMVCTSKDGRHAYRCQSKYNARTRAGCNQSRQITEKKVQSWLHGKLAEMLNTEAADLLARQDGPEYRINRVEILRTEIDEVETKVRKLIEKQITAPDALASLYDEQLRTFADQLKILRTNLLEAERAEKQRDKTGVQHAYKQLKQFESLDSFWEQPETSINQLLYRLMGNRRLVVLDRQIVGTTDAP